MVKAVIRNYRTGQRKSFKLPCSFGEFAKIGVTDEFEGQVYVENGPDTLGFGLDGFLYVDELKSFLQNYKDSLNPYHFDYMMLSRLQSDCDYFLGNGNRYEPNLWAGNVDGQIKEMKTIWKKFPDGEKPEWLTWEEILNYEKRMKGDV